MGKTEEITPPVAAREVAAPPRIDERYRIEKEIGRGGMGRVFVAHDRKLGRDVAIKVLASGLHGEEALRRFEQEARATCALNHANILDVHDIGTHEGSPYIVSELLHGITLRERLRRGRLSMQEASGYALQLAQGLSAAHEKGIVHRDLKPENLFITEEGRLKILDFGIAKLVAPLRPETGGTLPSPQPHTEEGAILGTVGYMSPEQVRGQPADQRSDVFSFGAIVYEMLAGRNAFERDTAVETGSAILNDDPPPLPGDVSATLRRLVQRCLAKRPEDRFQSARELAGALAPAGVDRAPAQRRIYRWALGGAAALILIALAVLGWILRARGEGRGNSIAVLPFVNMSSDRENEYFSDGITEELIHALANVEGLRVSSRTSAFAFKGKDVSVRKIGEELNVATVLEGSVRREGASVRVTAQLVNVADGYHLWSKTYDRELKNIFALEDELARSIAQALTPRLGAREPAPLVRSATASTAAHDAYLRGRYFWNQRAPESLRRAISSFQQAIAEDPSYALAYAGLGESYLLLADYARTPIAEQLPKAKQAVQRAVELDATLAEAHAALGLISQYEYDWSTAEREYRRAIELNPQYATAHQWYSRLLRMTGRVAEARTEIDHARRLDPTSLIINSNSAEIHIVAHEYAEAIEDARKTLELDPHFDDVRGALARAYTQTGRYAEALREIDAIPRDLSLGMRGYVLAISGQRDAARRVLTEYMDQAGRGHISPSSVALIHVGLGDKDAAFAWLDKAYAEREPELGLLRSYPFWDSLRSDPRFARLLQRLHLE